MTMPAAKLLTYSDYLALPDGRYEIILGELVVPPAPDVPHQSASLKLSARLLHFLEAHPGNGLVLAAPLDVILEDTPRQTTTVQPDIVYLAEAHRGRISKRGIEGAPDWVVEILSSNTAHDRVKKMALYARFGIGEYWIVDRAAAAIEVYRLDSATHAYQLVGTYRGLEAVTTPLLPGFSVTVADVLRPL